jgi:hypothetical protein
MSETVTSSPAPNDDKPLVRVFEKRELLSQVLDLVGEGTEIAAMLVCKDVCKFVRLLRGWQRGKKEEKEEDQKIGCDMSVSRVSMFVSSVGLAEWGTKWLGMPMTARTTWLAVKGGHVCTLDWLLGRDAPLAPLDLSCACCWASEAGHLSMLQYLRNVEPPYPWGEEVCVNAAKNGHLEMLQWARSQPEPCPWNEMACAAAAENGHLEVLQWLRSQPVPCPWDASVVRGASECGQDHVIEWLQSLEDPDLSYAFDDMEMESFDNDDEYDEDEYGDDDYDEDNYDDDDYGYNEYDL